MGTKAEAEARAKYEAFLSQLRNMHVRIRGRDRPLTEEERRTQPASTTGILAR
jgi:hypothetical protein